MKVFTKIKSLIALFILAANASAQPSVPNLLDVRADHQTQLIRNVSEELPAEEPPAEDYRRVQYPGPLGPMNALLAEPRETVGDDGKYPAMVWITGGFPVGGAGSFVWEEPDRDNDQSAQSYRDAGLVVLYPGLRGGYGNPSHQETFYGEVDDVLAALKYLKAQPDVDPERIYLGGHSTGGTLALLVAASTDGFAGVFCFGPTSDPFNYGQDNATYDISNANERRLRAPVEYLGAIRSPTWIIEGRHGGLEALEELEARSRNPNITFAAIDNADHFDVLYPVNEFIAEQVSTRPPREVRFALGELQNQFDQYRQTVRETDALETLYFLRRANVPFDKPQTMAYYFYTRYPGNIDMARAEALKAGFTMSPAEALDPDEDGDVFYRWVLRRDLELTDLQSVFAAAESAQRMAYVNHLQYAGWTLDDGE